MAVHVGNHAVLSKLWHEAQEPLWHTYRQGAVRATGTDKRNLCSKYQYAFPVLTATITEWLITYGGNAAYTDFYALKLRKIALLYAFGETSPNQLIKIQQAKPRVINRFHYISDEWTQLEDNTLKNPS